MRIVAGNAAKSTAYLKAFAPYQRYALEPGKPVLRLRVAVPAVAFIMVTLAAKGVYPLRAYSAKRLHCRRLKRTRPQSRSYRLHVLPSRSMTALASYTNMRFGDIGTVRAGSQISDVAL